MKTPTLFVLAAGMGSRYGGLKQLDPLGPNGETIMDYSWTVPAGTTSVRFYAEDRTQLTRTIVTTTDAAAVTDITADAQSYTPEYYTLQGHRLIHRPSAPGLYLERRGPLTRKILIAK